MNKDGCYTAVHMHNPRNADLFEDVCKDQLPSDDIFVPLQHQPINPEDEDDVVPDQHAAFGIQQATQTVREPAWKDLGLAQLMRRGPRRGGFAPGGGFGNGGAAGGSGAGGPSGLVAGAGGSQFFMGGNRDDTSGSSYAYYAYYYGYNANAIGSSLRGVSGAGAAPGAGAVAGSPGGGSASSASRGQQGAGRAYRGMPR